MSTIQPSQNKEENATHVFRLTVRDRDHFYKIVNWLNDNVGRGKTMWTMEGRVLRGLKDGKSVTRKVFVYVDDFDISSAMYLNLL